MNCIEKKSNTNKYITRVIKTCNKKDKCRKVVYENNEYLNTQVLPCKYLHENETIENYDKRNKLNKVLFNF